MTDEQIYQGLQTVFHYIFDNESIVLKPETSAADIEGWDSFNHVNIVVAAEQAFGISFSTSEIETLKNVGDLVATIRSKNPQRSAR